MEKRPRERESESEEETTLAPKRARGGKVILTDEEIKEKTERLAQECAKEKPPKKRVKCLMEATHLGRRAWVENELPRVSEVLEKFPPLKQPKHVSHSFGFGVERINKSFEKDYSILLKISPIHHISSAFAIF